MSPEAEPTQDNLPIQVKSELGKDVLLFRGFSATEQLGRLFQFDVDVLSTDAGIQLQDVLGKPMTVQMDLPGGGGRYFNGLVSRFSQEGAVGSLTWYHATLRPWLWFLTRTADCQIFQEMTVPDIIKKVFKDKGFTDVEDKLAGTYRSWLFCVQYRETAFNFVSRLMEQEGIYYYFKHTDGKHQLVLADDYSSHEPFPDYDTIPFYPPTASERRERDHISEWSVAKEVQTGTFVLDSYDFEKPKGDLLVKSTIKKNHAHDDAEFFDHPGEYLVSGEGNAYVNARVQELAVQHEIAQGEGNAHGIAVGSLFSLDGCGREDQNREYLVVSTNCQAHEQGYESGAAASDLSFSCNFRAIPSEIPYRSPRVTPKPIVQGPQTAVVVGPQGEEIWTDKYGRIKVQFFWDRHGNSDENSSCWMRVAQVWSGKTFGGIQIPRIGEEVLVNFLEGDPDQPLVTGRVYNADCMPPYKLPDNQTQAGFKTRSSKQGDAKTFNELRFEDKKGEEEIYLHAEKDFNRVVENNDTLKVGLDDKDPGDQTIEIYNNRTTTLEEGKDKLEVKKGDREALIGRGNYAVQVKQGNHSLKVDAGKSAVEAMKSIEFKVGQSSVKIEPAKITLKSTMIVIEATAKVEVKGAMADVKGSGKVTIEGGVVMIN